MSGRRPWAVTEQQRRKLDEFLAIDGVQMDVQAAAEGHPELEGRFILADAVSVGLRVLLGKPLPPQLATAEPDLSDHDGRCDVTAGGERCPSAAGYLVTRESKAPAKVCGPCLTIAVPAQGTVTVRMLPPRARLECPFTHAHTRDWCGYEGCRAS